MADLPKNSPDKIRALRAMSHDEYLQSPWWRLRRHARLKKADGKCERCGRVTSIADVHHVYYNRKGAELDSDLEVACRDCHRKLHEEESRKQHIRQYEMLARETLRLDHPTSFDVFQDAFRTRCEYFHLPIDHRFHDTITIVWSKKEVSLVTDTRRREVAALRVAVPDLPPIGKREAVTIARQLGMRFPFRSFPEQYGIGTGVAASRARATARLQAERCPSCRWQGAIISRVSPGFLSCEACHHKWPIPAEEP